MAAYKRESPNRGGSGRYIQSHEPSHTSMARHAMDMALCQSACATMTRRMHAHRLAGFTGASASYRVILDARRIVTDCIRLISRSYHVLTPKQRAMCERIVGPEETARISELHVRDETPVGLRYLPKRPPSIPSNGTEEKE